MPRRGDARWRRIDKNPKIAGPDAKAAVKEATNTLLDVLLATLEQGRVDAGAALVLAPRAVQFAAGGSVADGAQVENALRKIAAAGRSQPGFPQVHFDAENYSSVDLHTLSVPVSPGDEDTRKVFGDQLDAVLGTGRQSAFVALGKGSSGLLKGILDASASAAAGSGSPARALVSLAPVLKFAASVDDDKTLAALADSLASTPGRDHISLTARSVERGVVYRLEVEDGILQLIGAAAKLQGTEAGNREEARDIVALIALAKANSSRLFAERTTTMFVRGANNDFFKE